VNPAGAAFDRVATQYDEVFTHSCIGRAQRQLVHRELEAIFVRGCRILDLNCGTGEDALHFGARGVEVLACDASPAMIEVARGAAADDRLRFVAGTAERLPWPAATFDLVVSTTSFDHWADQRAGLAECARVLAPGGCLVLADLFSVLLAPILLTGRRGKARTKRRATQLVMAAGLHSPQWHRLYAVIIQAVTATK
jgi:ubiquinone/menaquinone biosynthesis C-methylase UbiE